MLRACYRHDMANIQVKNVPEEIHRRLRSCAKRRGQTLREVVLEAVRRELSHEQFIARLHRRRPVDLGRPASAFLREARVERESKL
jgi:plasmid stability protein